MDEFDKYKIDISKGQTGKLSINPKLVEQTRRFLTRMIWIFHHSYMEGKGGEVFEQWHEDKAQELLAFLNMSDGDRAEATRNLSVGSVNQKRLDAIEF